MIEADLTLYIRKHFSIRSVLNFRVCPHQLDKAVKAGASLGVDFHELHQLADRGNESGDIESKGQQVYKIQLATHDQQSAGSDHRDLHDADGGFDPGIEKSH